MEGLRESAESACERWYATETPEMPAPMITTSLWEGKSVVERCESIGCSLLRQYGVVGLGTGRYEFVAG